MSYTNPGIVLFLRPSAAIQPYRVNECAEWLVEMGKFRDSLTAKRWLDHLENYHIGRFKYVMSQYFELNIPKYIDKNQDVDKYHEDFPVEQYGEPHMY